MPFRSERQRRYLYANHPAIARRWQKESKMPSAADKELNNPWGTSQADTIAGRPTKSNIDPAYSKPAKKTGKRPIAKVRYTKVKKRKKLRGGIVGKDKGMWRKTEGGYQRRRFTSAQRAKFRAKRGGGYSGPPTGGAYGGR